MFPCEKCGACCRIINDIFFVEGLALPDGACKFLDKETNLCTIYSSRPVFCNVDSYYEKFLSRKMTREEFYFQNKKFCQQAREQLRDKNRTPRQIISFEELPQSFQKKLNGGMDFGNTDFD